ncbi:hypothetical protein BWQ96_03045 [Gracilariopsis chorda]|uniref:Uncharacterized protein n=1 Tax=Gracilariopsis chorda TaxID=448386 RepID=A0A2V3IYG5_9FLOR|nr:hypothetical protein BWQ96_03045 [Gracilariopsis chorda]|eukprot:PXF47103.1 hypothetical protein BWQ96_03045 [Gracilariopsis chorda]
MSTRTLQRVTADSAMHTVPSAALSLSSSASNQPPTSGEGVVRSNGDIVHSDIDAIGERQLPPNSVMIPTASMKRRLKASDRPGVPTGTTVSARALLNRLYQERMRRDSNAMRDDFPIYTAMANSVKDDIRSFLYHRLGVERGTGTYSSVRREFPSQFIQLKRKLVELYPVLAAAQSGWVMNEFIKEPIQMDKKAAAEASKRRAKTAQPRYDVDRPGGNRATPQRWTLLAANEDQEVQARVDIADEGHTSVAVHTGHISEDRNLFEHIHVENVFEIEDAGHSDSNNTGSEEHDDYSPEPPQNCVSLRSLTNHGNERERRWTNKNNDILSSKQVDQSEASEEEYGNDDNDEIFSHPRQRKTGAQKQPKKKGITDVGDSEDEAESEHDDEMILQHPRDMQAAAVQQQPKRNSLFGKEVDSLEEQSENDDEDEVRAPPRPRATVSNKQPKKTGKRRHCPQFEQRERVKRRKQVSLATTNPSRGTFLKTKEGSTRTGLVSTSQLQQKTQKVQSNMSRRNSQKRSGKNLLNKSTARPRPSPAAHRK